MEKEVKGTFVYEQDSKRYHRFQIKIEEGGVGMLYIPKDSQPLPERVILERVQQVAASS